MRSIYRLLRFIYRKFFRPDQGKALAERGLVLGSNVSIEEEVNIDWSHCWHIEMGDDVTIAPRVQVLAHDASTKRYLGLTRIGKVRIGSRVFLGASAIILPGVTIGDDVVVGAGSVVTEDIPARTVAAGNPARSICSLDEFLAKRRAEAEAAPCFGAEYADMNNPTPEMKAEMNLRMNGGVGFIV